MSSESEAKVAAPVATFALGDEIERFAKKYHRDRPQAEPGVVDDVRRHWVHASGEGWSAWFDTSRLDDLILSIRKT